MASLIEIGPVVMENTSIYFHFFFCNIFTMKGVERICPLPLYNWQKIIKHKIFLTSLLHLHLTHPPPSIAPSLTPLPLPTEIPCTVDPSSPPKYPDSHCVLSACFITIICARRATFLTTY